MAMALWPKRIGETNPMTTTYSHDTDAQVSERFWRMPERVARWVCGVAGDQRRRELTLR